VKDQEGQQGPDSRRREARKDRDGMDITFVQDSQQDVDHHDSQDKQEPEAFEGSLENLGRPDKARRYIIREHLASQFLDLAHRFAQRRSRFQVKGDGHRGKLAHMVYLQGPEAPGDMRDGAQGNLFSLRRGDEEKGERIRIKLVLMGKLYDDLVLVYR